MRSYKASYVLAGLHTFLQIFMCSYEASRVLTKLHTFLRVFIRSSKSLRFFIRSHKTLYTFAIIRSFSKHRHEINCTLMQTLEPSVLKTLTNFKQLRMRLIRHCRAGYIGKDVSGPLAHLFSIFFIYIYFFTSYNFS